MILAKKGDTVNAIQFTGKEESLHEIQDFVDGEWVSITNGKENGPVLNLPHNLKAKTGDYVLKDGNGHISVEPAWIVEGSYEKIKDINGETSDGYHTFNELYYHRMMLFAVICNTYNHLSWKSWQHDDGSMYDNYFIVGITTPEGDYTYHYHKQYWDMFNVAEYDKANKWDGHKPEDIGRLLSLLSANDC